MRTVFAATPMFWAAAFVLLAASGQTMAAPSGRAHGKLLFDRDCASCHQIGPGAISLSGGPALNGIIGMPAGDEPGFGYSVANQRCAIIWSAATFDSFIANPKAMMPGTTMAYAGMKRKADRDALYAYVSAFDAHGMTK